MEGGDLAVGFVVALVLYMALLFSGILVAAPALIAAFALNAVDVPNATVGPILWGLVWVLAGYALYGAAYGALGALVGRQQEVGQATAQLALLLVCGYLGSTFAVGDPDAWWVAPLSLLPPFSPMMMPMRIAADAVSTGEILAALALTLAAAVVLIVFGARVYRAGITRTGPRVRLREALGV